MKMRNLRDLFSKVAGWAKGWVVIRKVTCIKFAMVKGNVLARSMAEPDFIMPHSWKEVSYLSLHQAR